ncbi:hypothetical protein ACPXCP_34045 [Streptomyces sp. DT20]
MMRRLRSSRRAPSAAHAEKAAARYGIALVDSMGLRAWATFGKPLELT